MFVVITYNCVSVLFFNMFVVAVAVAVVCSCGCGCGCGEDHDRIYVNMYYLLS